MQYFLRLVCPQFLPSCKVLLGILALCLSLTLGFALPTWPAQAAIDTHNETSAISVPEETKILAQSLHRIRDDRDRPWQVSVFKTLEPDGNERIYLRLVGLPGMGYPEHAVPMRVVTGRQRELLLPDVSLQEPNLVRTAGQYDMKVLMTQLKRNPPLKLHLPIQNIRANSVLTVAPFVVREWRRVALGSGEPTLLAQSLTQF